MRVIAGSARGRPLRAPKRAPTRPTGDRIKGAIFSMLEAEAYKRGFEPDEEGRLASGLAWPRVLDLYAGSGALALEALSRGARHAVLVERDLDAVRTTAANLRSTGLGDQARVLTGAVAPVLGRLEGPFDLVFLDPPYDDTADLEAALAALARLLAPTSVVVLEQAASTQPPAAVGDLPLRSTRTHGRTRLTVYAAPHEQTRGA